MLCLGPVRLVTALDQTVDLADQTDYHVGQERGDHDRQRLQAEADLVVHRIRIVEQEAEAVSAGKQETGKAQPVLYRRRRRINVSELFSDPEEDLRPFDAPQNVINSQQAYHEPVYPRGWKKSEDEKE